MVRTRWVVLGVLGLVVVAPFALTAPLPAGHVVDVAERFRPVGYTATDQMVEPRRLWCLGDNTCPSLQQHWKFDTEIATDQLVSWLAAAGYSASVRGRCDGATGGLASTCSAHGTSEGQDVAVYVEGDTRARTWTLTLFVS
ncbi:MAG TPA: hypothetical protein VFW79_05840 [Cellulomonas sp.]|uniref:hypothetical protein n=1 Tax=Cellulomonas sp. TaxID=40001 RepID=UPI002E37BADD|nr:hypothetical protein [Cellulomonas sp.]HEX5332146.1 hypothetical protein [Cellulomonas sp.]